MHGRIVSVQVDSDKLKMVTDVYVESVVPAAEQQAGFRGALLFTDEATGKAVSITLWDSEEDLMKGQQSGYYREQIGKFTDYFVRTPEQVGYQVSYCSVSNDG